MGYFSALAAGRGARVYAFEPVDAAFLQLRKVKHLNPHLDITVENFAVGHKNAKAVMRVWRTEKLAESYLPREIEGRKLAGEGQEIAVNMLKLDSYVAKKEINRLDLMKIDVEGYESFVLEGARESIRRYRPTIICEVAPDEYRGRTFHLIKEISQECGYKITYADGKGIGQEFTRTSGIIDIVLHR